MRTLLDDRAVLVPRSAIAARYRASEAVRRGTRDLLVAGGDGTIHAVLPTLVGHPTRLGIVPCGTSNDLAKSVGMASAPRAIEALVAGRSAPLDLLRIGTHWVATAGGFGLAAQIADAANRWRARPWRRALAAPIGAHLYAAVAATEILRRRPRPVGLRVDGALWKPCTATAILVSRVPTFGGGLRLSRAPLAPGTFAITVVASET